jgi:type IV pilus assembly protein PilN
MRQDNQLVTLQGVAQSNERVSELLRNIGNNSPWFTKPELIEIVAGTVKLGANEQRKISNFNMRVRLVRSSEVQKTQAAPGGTSVAVPAAGMPVKK